MRALQTQHAEAQSILTAGGVLEGAAEEVVDPDPRAARPAGSAAAAAATRALGSAPAPDSQAGTFIRGDKKVGRNEPCPCGSGKKFKHCHGTLVDAE